MSKKRVTFQDDPGCPPTNKMVATDAQPAAEGTNLMSYVRNAWINIKHFPITLFTMILQLFIWSVTSTTSSFVTEDRTGFKLCFYERKQTHHGTRRGKKFFPVLEFMARQCAYELCNYGLFVLALHYFHSWTGMFPGHVTIATLICHQVHKQSWGDFKYKFPAQRCSFKYTWACMKNHWTKHGQPTAEDPIANEKFNAKVQKKTRHMQKSYFRLRLYSFIVTLVSLILGAHVACELANLLTPTPHTLARHSHRQCR